VAPSRGRRRLPWQEGQAGQPRRLVVEPLRGLVALRRVACPLLSRDVVQALLTALHLCQAAQSGGG
jgi:hypothetical protein